MIAILRKTVVGFVRPIICSPPRFFSDCKKPVLHSPAMLDLLLHKYQFSNPVASRAASVLTRVHHPQKSDSVLSFLKDNGFSNAQLERMAKLRPRILVASIEEAIKPRIRVLHELGIPSDFIPQIVSLSPTILCSNLNTRIIPGFNFLKRRLGTADAVARVWMKAPRFLSCNLERDVLSNMRFLESLDVAEERILKLLCRNPNCFMLSPGTFRKSVEKAKKMGVSSSSKLFIHAIQVLSSFSHRSWEVKLQGFRNCGFSESDVLEMFRKAPIIFSLTPERFKRVIDVFLSTGKYDMDCVIHYPPAVGYSIEKRYMPRFHILEILESQDLIEDWPTLVSVSQMSDEKFVTKFVKPYLSKVKELCKLSKELGINTVKAPEKGTTGLQAAMSSDGRL